MSIQILGAGCAFPSGPTLALADIACRTQLALVRRHPFCTDRCGIPISASYFPQLALGFGLERWKTLACNALMDSLQYFELSTEIPVRLWLVLPPEDRPGVPLELSHYLSSALCAYLPPSLKINIVRGSHAAAGQAILQAAKAQENDTSFTPDIVLAVDSWLPPASLVWLEAQNLLHGSRSIYEGIAKVNPYGRIPAEGAAAIILAKAVGQPAWCSITGFATALEVILRRDDRPCLGLGLMQAARQAIAQTETSHISRLVTDINGEPYRSDEFGFTVSRLNTVLDPDFQRIAPVLASGDLGCASLATHIALTAWHLRKAFVTERDASHLLLSSSDDEQRSAMVLRPIKKRELTC